MSPAGTSPRFYRYALASCLLTGYIGFGWLADSGRGLDDLSPGEEATNRDMAILLSNAILLLGVVVTFVVFHRAWKRFGVEGSPMHPGVKLLTGLLLTGGLTLLFAQIG